MASLQGKIAFISAAGSAIGRACYRALSDCGARVCLADRDASGIGPAGAGNGALKLAVNPRDEASWVLAFRRCQDELGRLDVVVLCDGGGSSGQRIADTSLATFQSVLYDTGLVPWLAQKQAVLAMRRGGRGGAIVHVTSLLGVIAAPQTAALCAGAAGSVMTARAAALECAKAGDGIVINTVLSAPLNSASADFLPDAPRVAAEDVAAAVVFYATDGAAYMTGTQLPVDAGLLCR